MAFYLPQWALGLILAALILTAGPHPVAAQCSYNSNNTAPLDLLWSTVDAVLATLMGLFLLPAPRFPNDYTTVLLSTNSATTATAPSDYSWSAIAINAGHSFTLDQIFDAVVSNDCNTVAGTLILTGRVFAMSGFQIDGTLTFQGGTISGHTLRNDPDYTDPMTRPHRVNGALAFVGTIASKLINDALVSLSVDTSIPSGSKLIIDTNSLLNSTANNIVALAGELELNVGNLDKLSLPIASTGKLTLTTAAISNSAIALNGGLVTLAAGISTLSNVVISSTSGASQLTFAAGSTLKLVAGQVSNFDFTVPASATLQLQDASTLSNATVVIGANGLLSIAANTPVWTTLGTLAFAGGNIQGTIPPVTASNTLRFLASTTSQLSNSAITLAGGVLSILDDAVAELTAVDVDATDVDSQVIAGTNSLLHLINSGSAAFRQLTVPSLFAQNSSVTAVNMTVSQSLQVNNNGLLTVSDTLKLPSGSTASLNLGKVLAAGFDAASSSLNVLAASELLVSGTASFTNAATVEVSNSGKALLNDLTSSLATFTVSTAGNLAVTGSATLSHVVAKLVSGGSATLNALVASANVTVTASNSGTLVNATSVTAQAKSNLSITDSARLLVSGLTSLANSAVEVFAGGKAVLGDLTAAAGSVSVSDVDSELRATTVALSAGVAATVTDAKLIVGGLLSAVDSTVSFVTSEAQLTAVTLTNTVATFDSSTLEATALSLVSGSLTFSNNAVANLTSFTQQAGNSTFQSLTHVVADVITIVDGVSLVAGVGELATLSLEGGSLAVSGQLIASIETVVGGVLDLTGANALLNTEVLKLQGGALTVDLGATLTAVNANLVSGTANLLSNTVVTVTDLVSDVTLSASGLLNATTATLTNTLTVTTDGLVTALNTTASGPNSGLLVAGALSTQRLLLIDSAQTVITGLLTAPWLEIQGGKFIIDITGIVRSETVTLSNGAELIIKGLLESTQTLNGGILTLAGADSNATVIIGTVATQDGGVLIGQGKIDGPLTSDGIVGQFDAQTQVTTTTFTNNGVMQIFVSSASNTSNTVILVTGEAQIDGALDVRYDPDNVPAEGSEFFVSWASNMTVGSLVLNLLPLSTSGDGIVSINGNNGSPGCGQPTASTRTTPTSLSIVFGVSSDPCAPETNNGVLSTQAIAGIAVAGFVVVAGVIVVSILFGVNSIRKKIMPWRYRE